MVRHLDKTQARHLGEQGEQAVAEWYQGRGWHIIARNWRCFEGELDIIAGRDDTVVFCEVKSRSSNSFRDPALAVDRRKQAKLRTAAFRWLATEPQRRRIRFDVALVVAGSIQVIEDAF